MISITESNWHKKVDKAIISILNSLDDDLSYKIIANEVASSPFHFHKKFKELTGESFQACVRRLKLERASWQIRNTKRSITHIAFDAGYGSSEAFSKAYRKAYTINPTFIKTLPRWNGKIYSKAGIHYSKNNKVKTWFYVRRKENTMDTKIVNIPKKTLYAIRNQGKMWNLPKTWKILNEELDKYNLSKYKLNFMTIIFDNIQFAAFEIPEKERISFPFEKILIDEGFYAVTIHYGICEDIGQVWGRWESEWLNKSGWNLDMNRPKIEMYSDLAGLPEELQLTYLCTPVIRDL